MSAFQAEDKSSILLSRTFDREVEEGNDIDMKFEQNPFMQEAARLNPELDTLKKELQDAIKQRAEIKQQMSMGIFAGKLSTLSELEDKIVAIQADIEKHPDSSSKSGFDNLAGSREETMRRKFESGDGLSLQ